MTNNTAAPPSFRQGSPGTPNRRPASIRIETEDQRNQRLAEENEKARLKAEAEETAKKEKEDAERKIKEAQERKRGKKAEKMRIRKEREEKIDTKAAALRRHLGLTDAKKSNIPAPQSALATARVISDIKAVSYPEGVSSPNPALNQHAKDGKFRCVSVFGFNFSFGFMI